MTIRRILVSTILLGTLASVAFAGPREDSRLATATAVLTETQGMPDQSVPNWLLQRAEGIAVLPTVVKVGLVLGGRGGKGVLAVRDVQGRWSNPMFITLAGGSFGWQAGIETSDIILVFTTRRSLEGVTGGKLTLGVDAAVAAGPVGRQASAATDIGLSEVYCYSRSRGLFAGLAIDGSVLTIDNGANSAFYGRTGLLGSDILSQNLPLPATARPLLDALDRITNSTPTPAPAPAAMPAASVPSDAAPSGRGLESGAATSYPLDDAKPR
jgi:lipid-binding SYLF domain-containing protein